MGTELLCGRRKVAARALAAELIVGNVASVTIGIAEMQARFGRVVQLIGRSVVAHAITPVVSKPKLFGDRMPVKANRVAHATGKYFKAGAVRFHARNHRIAVRVGFADVARRAHWDIKQAVGPESDKFPTVRPFYRKAIADDDRLGRAIQPRFDIVIAKHSANLGDIKRAVVKRHTIGRLQSLGDSNDASRAFFCWSRKRIDFPRPAGADEYSPFRTQDHGASIANIVNEDGDFESRRQLDLLQRRLSGKRVRG